MRSTKNIRWKQFSLLADCIDVKMKKEKLDYIKWVTNMKKKEKQKWEKKLILESLGSNYNGLNGRGTLIHDLQIDKIFGLS